MWEVTSTVRNKKAVGVRDTYYTLNIGKVVKRTILTVHNL